MGPSKRKPKPISPSQIQKRSDSPSLIPPPKRRRKSSSPPDLHEPDSPTPFERPPPTAFTPALFTIEPLQLATPTPTPIYIVRPTSIWNALTIYRECIVNNETLTFNNDITLPHPTHPGIWTARILEIRGSDTDHVYLRIYWYYTPSQLPTNVRYEMHPDNNRSNLSIREQLYLDSDDSRVYFASNNMAVINAKTVTGRLRSGVCHVWNGERTDNLPAGPWWMHRFDARRGVVVSGGELDFGGFDVVARARSVERDSGQMMEKDW